MLSHTRNRSVSRAAMLRASCGLTAIVTPAFAEARTGRRRYQCHHRHRYQARLDDRGRAVLDQCANAGRHPGRGRTISRISRAMSRACRCRTSVRGRARSRCAASRPARSCATSTGVEQVGVYLDESVISLSLFTPDLDLFDLNRVETLRGPQGTLFGSGSVGGTIRLYQPARDRCDRRTGRRKCEPRRRRRYRLASQGRGQYSAGPERGHACRCLSYAIWCFIDAIDGEIGGEERQ